MNGISSLSSTHKMVLIAMLSALGTLLMYLELPWVFYQFLRIDLSDVVVLVAFVVLGMKEGLLVAFIKAFIHFALPLSNYTAGVGEIAAFIASASYIVGYYLASNKLNLGVIWSLVLSIVFMTFTMTFLNWLIITPLYGIVLFGDVFPSIFTTEYIIGIISVYAPFNLLKGAVIMAVFYSVSKALQLELE